MTNYEKLTNNYKPSTISRMEDFGYRYKKDINNCDVLNRYFEIENDINKHKEQDILFEYLNNNRVQILKNEIKRNGNILSPSKNNLWYNENY